MHGEFIKGILNYETNKENLTELHFIASRVSKLSWAFWLRGEEDLHLQESMQSCLRNLNSAFSAHSLIDRAVSIGQSARSRNEHQMYLRHMKDKFCTRDIYALKVSGCNQKMKHQKIVELRGPHQKTNVEKVASHC